MLLCWKVLLSERLGLSESSPRQALWPLRLGTGLYGRECGEVSATSCSEMSNCGVVLVEIGVA
ncbi:hypothetical protein HMPREF9621_02797 [Cutibacterium modestum HL037PA2]|nr:hypothetical protein HMPREF9621_02797 [Cutibacterium modestum HL037PA2]